MEQFSEQEYKAGHKKRTKHSEFYLLDKIHHTQYAEVWVVADENAIKRSPNYTGNNAAELHQLSRFQFILKLFPFSCIDHYENEKAALKKLDLFEPKHLVKLETTADRGELIENRLNPVTDEYEDVAIAGSDAFIVTKRINGMNLSDQQKEWSAAQLLALLPQFKAVMDELNQFGIIHRDISANNLLLDSSGYLYLIDFASSKFTTNQTNLCGKGTQGYRAPEVKLLDPQVDTSADLFSLAAVFYFLLTKSHIDEINSTVGLAPELEQKNHQSNLQALQQISQTLANKSAPQRTIKAFLTAFDVDPKARFTSIDAFFTEFTHALESMALQQSQRGVLELERSRYGSELTSHELTVKKLTNSIASIEASLSQLKYMQGQGLIKTQDIQLIAQGDALLLQLQDALKQQKQHVAALQNVLADLKVAIDAAQAGRTYQTPKTLTLEACNVQEIVDDKEVLLMDLQHANASALAKLKSISKELAEVSNTELSNQIAQIDTAHDALRRFVRGINQKSSLKVAAVINRAIAQVQQLDSAMNEAKAHLSLPSSFTSGVQLLNESLIQRDIDITMLKKLMGSYQQLTTEKNHIIQTRRDAQNKLSRMVADPMNQVTYWQAELQQVKGYKKTKVTLAIAAVFGGVVWGSQYLPKEPLITLSHGNLMQGSVGIIKIVHSQKYQHLDFKLDQAECIRDNQSASSTLSVFNCQLNTPGEQVYSIHHQGKLLETAKLTVAKRLYPLIHRVTPSDATILVDGKVFNQHDTLTEGQHTFTVSREGYKTLTVTKNYNPKSGVEFSLELIDEEMPAVELVNVNQITDKTYTVGNTAFTLKAIPAGSFMMGCSPSDSCASYEWLDKDKKTRLNVNVPAFYLMEHEVTWDMYQPCIDEGVCPNNDKDGGDRGWGKNNRPVIHVSYNDIVNHYIPWLNKKTGQTFRLPSESEWEYAARAGSDTKYSWGNEINCKQAQYDGGEGSDCYYKDNKGEYRGAAPVMQFTPNAYGLYDMYGNVWEWTADCWNGTLASTPKNGKAATFGNCERSVLRGGAWSISPRYLRASLRDRYDRADRWLTYGFRLAQDSR